MKNTNQFFKKTVALMIAFMLIPILVNTDARGSLVINLQTLRAPVVYVDYDYGNGNPNDDNNNDQIDDTHKKTIQEGINAVDNNGIVYVCEVTSDPEQYRENVNINKSLNLRSLGWVRIDGMNTNHTITINANNVTIEKFKIINGFDGIHSEGHNKINIIANKIFLNNEEGIEFVNCGAEGAPVMIIENIIDYNERNGILLNNSEYVTINSNTIQNNRWNGVFLNNSQYVTINSNPSVIGNGIGGNNLYTRSNIMLEKCRWVNISDNPQIQNSDFIGIYIVNESENITVSNNNISNSWDDGINCEHNPLDGDNPIWPRNVTITNNIILQSKHEQVHIYSGSNILIQKNTIRDGEMTGITIDTNSGTNIKIRNNTIIGNGKVGPNWFAGILICGQHSVKVVNNTVKNNLGEGIFIHSDSGNPNNNHTIEWNTIQWNNWDGICIKEYVSHNNTIKNNTIANNGAAGGDYYGIRIMGASNNNKIYHNNITGNNRQAFDQGNNNWDNGHPSAGNYWSDFDEPSEGANDTCHGPNQNKNSSDGIVDKGGSTGGLNPYNISGGVNKDRYPVTKQSGWINIKPDKPTINGTNKGKTGKEYEYKFSTTDPEGYKLYYWVDWGDGTNSGWTGPNNSGEEIILKHTWNKKGTYAIKVKAKDTRDAESDWSEPLEVSIPRTIVFSSLLMKFLERYPNMFPILRHLLGL